MLQLLLSLLPHVLHAGVPPRLLPIGIASLSAKPTAAALAAAEKPVVLLAAPVAASPSTGDRLNHTLMLGWLLARLAFLLWLALAAAACKKTRLVCRPAPGQPPACRQGAVGAARPAADNVQK
ncbi:uncharacterized protein LOC133531923 isoform X2 [Cydia pomonella]|uniref:uncharacterized protein LOC133531923 isoform X2 n=1 Tax=Cydia pomonella TaxID=82600 RepID=UPI002ADDFBB3|nr:uncharacterized protein LOC133531923 isoform X2 [Cydia pomonella]